ncbi:MAG TPA: phosphopantetheine-binding protein [Acidimicrobiales bacterium]|nr:phosphopantetheine-binding protein [Acidimicrobiales bacterium]
MSFPTLDEAIDAIRVIADTDALDADMRIEDLDVDSIDMLEWLYEIEESVGVQIDESLFSNLSPSVRLREVYELVRDYVTAKSAGVPG